MDGLLEALYDRFYTPKEITELRRSVEANRALLRDRLPAEQRKIVLRIVDDLTMMANEGLLDSFLCGFKPAWQLTSKLNHIARMIQYAMSDLAAIIAMGE